MPLKEHLCKSFLFYILFPSIPRYLANTFNPIYKFLLNKWYFDELYEFLFVSNTKKLGAFLSNIGDKKIIDGFDSDTLNNQANEQDMPTPIFIIGMPRSGSTLIEQILSSHSEIEGTMELMTLPNLERKIIIDGGLNFDKKYPESFKYFNEEQLADFGKQYLNQTSIYRTDKPYFIDKLPPNYERVGLIHKILPNAIIIDARRHPMACGFSIYKQHFAGGHEYSYDLNNIGFFYNCYLDVMDHFNHLIPEKIFTMQYENNVKNTETMTRELLDHIGVKYESACLEFYKNKRAVRTASSEQVRKPIYTGSLEQWRNYETELQPLKEALGDETIKRFEDYL